MRLQSKTSCLETVMSVISRIIFNFYQRQVYSEYYRAVLSLVEQNRDARLLDCGCGDGGFTLMMAERMGTREINAIDAMKEHVDIARAKGIQASQGDLNEKLPFEDESFDVIHAGQIIEHLHQTDAFVREIRRTLKTGGYAIISTPNLAASHNILYLLLGKQPPTATVSDELLAGTWHPMGKHIDATTGPAHYRLFTLSAIEELLEHHGLQVEKSIGAGFAPFPAVLARGMSFIDKRHAAYAVVKARKSN